VFTAETMKMPSSGMRDSVALVRTGVSEDRIASIIRVERSSEQGTMLAVTSNRSALIRLLVTVNVPSPPILVTPMIEEVSSSETSVLTKNTRRHIPQDGILHPQSTFFP
jgi:hypothetical protein